MLSRSTDILLHTLGLDERHAEPWRNHYVTSGANTECDALVAEGLMEEQRPPGFLAAGDRVFIVTEAGKRVARSERLRRFPKPTRDRARYLHWLSVCDAIGMTFGEYLRNGMYQTRERGW